MSFWATEFIYDSTPSTYYNLRIMSQNGDEEMLAGSASDLITQYAAARPRPYLLGVKWEKPLEFDLTMACEEEVTQLVQQKIHRWLCGNKQYKKLQIIQDDLMDVYFNCIFTDPTWTTIGNEAHFLTCHAVCDSPYAWEFPKTYKKTDIKRGDILNFNNQSDDCNNLFPILEFQAGPDGGDVEVINQDVSGCEVKFHSLHGSEIITFDCDRGEIKSSSGINRTAYSNCVPFELQPGMNRILVNTDLPYMKIIYQNAKAVSA